MSSARFMITLPETHRLLLEKESAETGASLAELIRRAIVQAYGNKS